MSLPKSPNKPIFISGISATAGTSISPRSANSTITQPSVIGGLETPVPGQPQALSPEQPHLVSLVLQSKKALQHGEHLCTRAHAASNASAQAAVDVLALDAKVRWVVEAVVEQLKLAASVAKSIEEKRAHIGKQVDEWDAARTKHTDALDGILESLGAQLVPPDFHQTSADSSLFGSQHGSDDEDPGALFTEPSPISRSPTGPLRRNTAGGVNSTHSGVSTSPVSPSATLRRNSSGRKYTGGEPSVNLKGKGRQQANAGPRGKKDDRRHWKTLRDFVDDQAIEDALDIIESDRAALDDVLSKTDDYPETLTRTINSIRASLPKPEPGTLKRIQDVVVAQEATVTAMAGVLENLASHYDGMAAALKETEKGESFSDEDLQNMNRDTEELPAIMAEMERDANSIEGYQEQLTLTKENSEKDLEHLHSVLDKLEELGEIMGEMLQTQDVVEVQAEQELNGLQHHLTTLVHLHDQFISYRMAFNKLILEVSRRRQYSEAAENIVRGMMKQLDSMTEEESRVRAHFNAEYGSHLPEDLCLSIGNTPTRWEVLPWEGTAHEVLPSIDNDIVKEAHRRVMYSDGPPESESL